MNRRALLSVLLLFTASLSAWPSARSASQNQVSTSSAESAEVAYARLPLSFEVNRGQTDPKVKYVSRGPGYGVFLTQDEVVLNLANPSVASGRPEQESYTGKDQPAETVLRMQLLASRPEVEVKGLGELSAHTNYLSGANPDHWVTDVPSYARVRYDQVYPGIDLIFHGDRSSLEYDFVVAAGADPAMIGVRFNASAVSVDSGGDLMLAADGASLRQPKPSIYQEVDGRRRSIDGGYAVGHDGRVGFHVGAYDRTRPLVIDPVLPYATYLGGSGDDGAFGVAVDSSGNAYVTGWTTSLDFPQQAPYQKAYGGEDTVARQYCDIARRGLGCGDAFVAKLEPGGSRIVYSTYLGGSGSDTARGVAVDSAGSAYVTGSTTSPNFPTKNAFEARFTGGPLDAQAFVTKLDPSGADLGYSTYLGGHFGSGNDVAVDASGGAYVTGSVSAQFPTKNGFQPGLGGGRDDAFVAKVDTAASGPASLVFSTYLGGDGNDAGNDIALDVSGNAYVAGNTGSPGFPTRNAFQAAGGRTLDAFVAKVNPTASGPDSLVFSTFLGGDGPDFGNGIAVDSSGSTYITGKTESANLPTKNALETAKKGKNDAFLARLDASGSALLYSSYLGAPEADGADIALDASAKAYLTGTTRGGLPVKEAPQPGFGGGEDAFIAQLDTAASGPASLVFSTYLGGGGPDFGSGVAVDPSGSAYVAGYTGPRSGFPTIGALQAAEGGGKDAFVAKISPSDPLAPVVTEVKPNTGAASGGTPVVISGTRLDKATAVKFGETAVSNFEVSSDGRRITLRLPPRAEGPVVVTVTTPNGTSGPGPGANFVYTEGAWSGTTAPAGGRFHHTATVLGDGKTLVAGGCLKGDNDGVCVDPSDSAQLYDSSSRRWSETGRMTAPRGDHTATLLPNGKVLVVGSQTAEVYDAEREKWTPTGPFAQAPGRQSSNDDQLLHTATLLPSGPAPTCGANCGKVLVVGVSGGGAALYDPSANTWTATSTNRRVIHTRHTATALPNGKVLVVGGDTPAELYDPSTGTFAATGDLQVPRAYHTATLLGGGRVLVVGGRDRSTEPTTSAELYDPDATDPEHPEVRGAWRAARGLAQARYAHSASVLSNGKVLVAGGSFTYGSRLASAELYDPASGRWKPAAEMNQGRGGAIPRGGGSTERVRGGSSFSATTLRDGSVLVVGGSDATAGDQERTSALASAEVYELRPSPAQEQGSTSSRIWLGLGGLLALTLLGLAILLAQRRRQRHAPAQGATDG